MKIRIPERREAGLQELQALAASPDQASAKAMKDRGRNKKDDKDQDENDKKIGTLSAVGNEIAHRALAWDHLQRGEFDAAAEELGNAAALNQRDMWIRYYLSVLKNRISQNSHTNIHALPHTLQNMPPPPH